MKKLVMLTDVYTVEEIRQKCAKDLNKL